MKIPFSTIRISPGLEVKSKHLPSKLEEDRLERVHRNAWQERNYRDEDYLTTEQKGWWSEISKTKPSYSTDNGMGSMYDLDRRPLSDRFASHSPFVYPQSQSNQPAALSHRTVPSHDAAVSHSRHFRSSQRVHTNGPPSNNHVNYTVVGVPPDTNSSTINLEIPIQSSTHTMNPHIPLFRPTKKDNFTKSLGFARGNLDKQDRNYQLDGNQGELSNDNGWWKSNVGGNLPGVDTNERLYLQDRRPHSDKYIDQTPRQRDVRRRSHQPAALDHRSSNAALDYKRIRQNLGHRQTHHAQRNHVSHVNRSIGPRSNHATYSHVPRNQYANVTHRSKAIQNELDSVTPYQKHSKQDVLSQSRHFRTTQLQQRNGHQENSGNPQAIQISSV